MEATLDKDKLNAFYEELIKQEVTVSSLQCGKQELSPASQIPMVDAMWSEFFPEYAGRACPIFNHANDQYANDCLYGDVMRVKDVKASRVIIADYDYDGQELEAQHMLSTSIWNGTNFEETTWDGTIGSALEVHKKMLSNRNEEYASKHAITDDWIVVTVDYHS